MSTPKIVCFIFDILSKDGEVILDHCKHHYDPDPDVRLYVYTSRMSATTVTAISIAIIIMYKTAVIYYLIHTTRSTDSKIPSSDPDCSHLKGVHEAGHEARECKKQPNLSIPLYILPESDGSDVVRGIERGS